MKAHRFKRITVLDSFQKHVPCFLFSYGREQRPNLRKCYAHKSNNRYTILSIEPIALMKNEIMNLKILINEIV